MSVSLPSHRNQLVSDSRPAKGEFYRIRNVAEGFYQESSPHFFFFKNSLNLTFFIRFLRGAVYSYPPGCQTIAKSFAYKDFADAVSGFIKFFIDNLNFLTFEDDRKTIVKVRPLHHPLAFFYSRHGSTSPWCTVHISPREFLPRTQRCTPVIDNPLHVFALPSFPPATLPPPTCTWFDFETHLLGFREPMDFFKLEFYLSTFFLLQQL